MISILKEFDNGFQFPESLKLTKNLKDILEENVSKKYFIAKEKYVLDICELPHQDISYCIDANYAKGTSIEGFINKKRRQLIQVGENKQPKTLTYGDVRKLTPLECWRLMAFNDEDFQKAKQAGLPDSKLYERAGRGIVVSMLEEIFKNLFNQQIHIPQDNSTLNFVNGQGMLFL